MKILIQLVTAKIVQEVVDGKAVGFPSFIDEIDLDMIIYAETYMQARDLALSEAKRNYGEGVENVSFEVKRMTVLEM